MRYEAKRVFDEIIRNQPTKRSLKNTELPAEGIRFSARFIYLGNIVLQTKNISSVQKFEYAEEVQVHGTFDHQMSQYSASVTTRGFLLGMTLLVFIVILSGFFEIEPTIQRPIEAGLFILFWIIAFFLGRSISLSDQFKKCVRDAKLRQTEYFVEVYMNSGRVHRFPVKKSDTADRLVKLFVHLISSDDQGTIYRLDQSTNHVVVDQSDHSISNFQLGDDLEFSVETDNEKKRD